MYNMEFGIDQIDIYIVWLRVRIIYKDLGQQFIIIFVLQVKRAKPKNFWAKVINGSLKKNLKVKSLAKKLINERITQNLTILTQICKSRSQNVLINLSVNITYNKHSSTLSNSRRYTIFILPIYIKQITCKRGCKWVTIHFSEAKFHFSFPST